MPRSLLITGSSTGIGEACALHFDRAGWRVFAGVRTEADGARLAARASSRLRPVLIDVAVPTSIAAAAARVSAELGDAGLDGLVNNAGIALGGPLEYFPPEELRRVLEVNVVGLLAVTQAMLPALRRARGRIVNIGSIAGRVTSPMIGPYSASKHAVEALTDALRMELAGAGIQVSVVEPGAVATPIWDKAEAQRQADRGIPEEGRERYRMFRSAMGRVIQSSARRGVPPEVVAGVVEHALTASRPRTRYLVGLDARVRLLLQQLLPRRWMDRLILRFFRRMAEERR